MMTWMTRMSFLDTAADMDDDRLLLAIEETQKLVEFMIFEEDPDGNLSADPVVRMWRGYEPALAAYGASLCLSAAQRALPGVGVALSLAETVRTLRRSDDGWDFVSPPWLEDANVLRSHRSNMMRRWPDVFTWKGTPALMPYIYPFVDGEGGYKLMLSKHDKSLLKSGERKLPSDIAKRIENL